ncbi:MAG: recombination mediator RecR [Mycoplasmataceae bacterium]|nr:recombination mediator RecR [Mycoplasmataceae bacterium]
MKPVSFGYLIDALKSLPGVGKKQAERIAYFLINKDEKYIDDLIQRIKNGKDNIHFCKQCNNFAEHELCDICSNQSRTQDKLCIVSTIEDLQKIEETNSYTGLYFVLNGEVDVKTKQTLNHIVIRQLMDLVRSHTFNEVIFATNWTINGEATAAFIKSIIKELSKTTNFYRLALGLPINSALDYADNTTLKYALQNKTKY